MAETNIVQAVKAARAEAVREMRAARDRARARVKAIESNFLARSLLAGEGIDLRLSPWGSCAACAELDLEEGRDLVRVRRALGVKLKATGRKELVERSRNRVWIFVEAEGFPGLVIKYKARLREAGRCKVVKRKRSYSERALVCER